MSYLVTHIQRPARSLSTVAGTLDLSNHRRAEGEGRLKRVEFLSGVGKQLSVESGAKFWRPSHPKKLEKDTQVRMTALTGCGVRKKLLSFDLAIRRYKGVFFKPVKRK